jgi:hypothetical protein
LRTAQHLHPFDIGQVGHAVDGAWQIDVVDIDSDRGIEDRIAVADAADEEGIGQRGDARRGGVQARYLTGQVARGDDILVAPEIIADDADGDRRGLEPRLPPRRRDQDVIDAIPAIAIGQSELDGGIVGSLDRKSVV